MTLVVRDVTLAVLHVTLVVPHVTLVVARVNPALFLFHIWSTIVLTKLLAEFASRSYLQAKHVKEIGIGLCLFVLVSCCLQLFAHFESGNNYGRVCGHG